MQYAIDLKCDNQSAMKIAKNPVSFQRSKHFDIKWNFIREEVTNMNVILTYCPTDTMLADICKPLTKSKFSAFKKNLNLINKIEGEC